MRKFSRIHCHTVKILLNKSLSLFSLFLAKLSCFLIRFLAFGGHLSLFQYVFGFWYLIFCSLLFLNIYIFHLLYFAVVHIMIHFFCWQLFTLSSYNWSLIFSSHFLLVFSVRFDLASVSSIIFVISAYFILRFWSFLMNPRMSSISPLIPSL